MSPASHQRLLILALLAATFLSISGVVLDNEAMALLGILLSTIVGMVAIVSTDRSCTVEFTASDWLQSGRDHVLEIPFSRHGIRTPDVSVFQEKTDSALKSYAP